MTTEKLVFNSLFSKTELATKKVDLALTDDILKLNVSCENLIKELSTAKVNLKNADDLIKKTVADAKKTADYSDKKASDGSSVSLKLADVIDKADAMAKDLGVSSNAIPGYVNANKNYVAIEKLISEINGFVFSTL